MSGSVIALSGFREYDARWRTPEEIGEPGFRMLGRALGTQMLAHGAGPRIVAGHDFRTYSADLHAALVAGLVEAGAEVLDIGLALTPMAYFAQSHLGGAAVAMVTASHNPNGWTGVKMGFDAPLTHGPREMAELRDIVAHDAAVMRDGGTHRRIADLRAAYLDDLAGGFRLARPLRVVVATGNGTAGAFAPELVARIGAEVIPRHTGLDAGFPNYNPNPEALEMLADMGQAVRDSGADLALGFDGDGDRCGLVDETGHEIFADKLGVLIARDLARRHPGARFIADVKSTGLFVTDPVLAELGARTEYAQTGHSHMKRRLAASGALAGFEKSGHFFFAPPVGRGYDCGLRVAVEVCRLLDRHPDRSIGALAGDLPRTWASPTLSPACPDVEKYQVIARLTAQLTAMAAEDAAFAGQRIAEVLTINGARVTLDDGSWGLVRASSNTPNLVVVCESPVSDAGMRAVFGALDALIRTEPCVGAYDQHLPSPDIPLAKSGRRD